MLFDTRLVFTHDQGRTVFAASLPTDEVVRRVREEVGVDLIANLAGELEEGRVLVRVAEHCQWAVRIAHACHTCVRFLSFLPLVTWPAASRTLLILGGGPRAMSGRCS